MTNKYEYILDSSKNFTCLDFPSNLSKTSRGIELSFPSLLRFSPPIIIRSSKFLLIGLLIMSGSDSWISKIQYRKYNGWVLHGETLFSIGY